MDFFSTLKQNLNLVFNKKEEEKPAGFIGPVQPKVSPVLTTIAKNLNSAPVPKLTRTEPTLKDKNLSSISGKQIIQDVGSLPAKVGRLLITRPIRMVAQSFQDIGGYLGDKEYTPEAYVPKTPIEKALFGDEPIESAVGFKRKIDKNVADLSEGQTGTNKALFATLGFMASFAPLGDILPGGKGKEKILEKIIKGPLDEIIEFGMKSANDADSFKILSQHVDEAVAKEYAPALTAAKTKKESETVLRNSVAKQLQITQYDAMTRIEELTAKQKSAPSLTADELEELKFLKANKDKPEAIIMANKVAESKDVPTKVTAKDASRDEVISGLSKMIDDSKSLVDSKGKIKLESMGEIEDIMQKVEKGTDTQQDLNRGREILKLSEASNTNKILAAEKERKYVTSAKLSEDIADDVSREISENYNPKSNKELREKSATRVVDDFEEAKKFANENSTDEAVATRVAVDKELSARYANATSDAEKQALATELKDSIISHARLATEEGRTVQANALLGKQTPEGMLRTTSRMIDDYNKTARVKVKQIGEKDIQNVLDSSFEINRLPEGLEKEVAKKKLRDTLESAIPSPIWKKVVNVWKAGLLTGIKTSGVNIQSNFWNGVAERVKDVPAVGIDMATSLFTGVRTKAFTLRGQFSGNIEGVKNGWNYLKTGVSEESAKSGLEFNKVHFDSKPGKVLEAYAEGVYRLLGAEDMPFFYGALKRSLGEQAIVTIKNEGKVFANSSERTKFIQDFMDNPPEGALALADLDAKMATFKNDTALGQMAQGLQNVPVLGPAVQMTVLPFAKTPSAVATAMFNYAPTGILSTFYKTFKDGGFNQKEFAEGLGRVATGFGALWLGSELYKSDLITLGYPDDEKTRAEWEATGKIPNSLHIPFTDVYFPLIQLGPVGSVLGIGGYYQKGKEESGSVAGGVAVGLFGGVKGLTEQTFLTGVQNLLKVVDDPANKAELYAGRVLGSVIPTVVSDFAQSFDDYQRKSTNFLDPFKSRVPELRETLRPKLDVWGQRLERNRDAISTAINPIRLSNTIQGELNTEVERMQMAGEDIRPTKVDAKIGNVKLNDEEYYIFQRMYGDLLGVGLRALIQNPEYQSKSAEEQAKLFKDGVSDIKKGVSETILPAFIKQRYDLPDDIDLKLATDLVERLSKVSPDFNKASTNKQRKLIIDLLNN